ncbi:hypothetical protein HK13_11750 [Acetobacter indonesiensis]|nr:hypothetical protein HK13_11750 [Acetobacter indonesiensis]
MICKIIYCSVEPQKTQAFESQNEPDKKDLKARGQFVGERGTQGRRMHPDARFDGQAGLVINVGNLRLLCPRAHACGEWRPSGTESVKFS